MIPQIKHLLLCCPSIYFLCVCLHPFLFKENVPVEAPFARFSFGIKLESKNHSRLVRELQCHPDLQRRSLSCSYHSVVLQFGRCFSGFGPSAPNDIMPVIPAARFHSRQRCSASTGRDSRPLRHIPDRPSDSLPCRIPV